MPAPQELLTRIRELLDHPAGEDHFELGKDSPDKAYEAFVFCLCKQAIVSFGGGQAQAKGIIDDQGLFVFRGGPGAIKSQSHTNYGYILCNLGGSQFEIHISLRVVGRSSVKHEVDVSFVRHGAAEHYRQLPGTQYATHSDLIGAYECKYYTGTVKMASARELVGVLVDLGKYEPAEGVPSVFKPSGLACPNGADESVETYLTYVSQRQLAPHLGPEQNEDTFMENVVEHLAAIGFGDQAGA